MTSNNREATPQARLAASRQTILHLMNARGEPHRGEPQPGPREQAFIGHSPDMPATAPSRSAWQTVRRALRVWWYNHPAQLALELGKPVLSKYAQEKPLQLLGISAAVGAAIIVLKPWRLVSVTSLAMTAIKSSQVSGVLLSLLTTQPHSTTQKEQP